MILEGKTLIVTGVGTGLGSEVVRAAHRDGANVVLAARTQATLEQLAKEVDPSGERVAIQPTDITDAVKVLSYLFASGELTCIASADSNDDGSVDITDGIYLLSWLFSGGNAPPPPAAECGGDPTADGLGCARFAACP